MSVAPYYLHCYLLLSQMCFTWFHFCLSLPAYDLHDVVAILLQVAEVSRVLRPGGVFVATTYILDGHFSLIPFLKPISQVCGSVWTWTAIRKDFRQHALLDTKDGKRSRALVSGINRNQLVTVVFIHPFFCHASYCTLSL